jgi:hypothetical protein
LISQTTNPLADMSADLKLLKVDAAIARLQRSMDGCGPSASTTTELDKLLHDRQTRIAQMEQENSEALMARRFDDSTN